MRHVHEATVAIVSRSLLLSFALSCVNGSATLSAQAADPVTFTRDVAPIVLVVS